MASRISGACAVAVATLAVACTGTIGDVGSDGSKNGSGPGGAATGGASALGAAGGVGANGTAGSSAAPLDAYASVARRLSQAELDNTVRDVLGDTTRPATTFLPEDEFSPYDNDYTLQVASQALIDSLDALAEDVAARVTSDPATRDRLVPCAPADSGDAVCFREVAEGLLTRAFRRPLQDGEVEPYLELLSFATEDNPYVDNDFYTAVELLVRAVIQDPEFLYRIEVGAETDLSGVLQLDSYEVATRLSYLLWGSAPDDELLSVAGAGTLLESGTRREQAVRMLTDDRAKQQLQRFHAMWLGYRAIPHSAELVTAFNRETSALIDRVVFEEDRSYLDLFTLEETYLDDFLADHYGLSRPASGPGWVPYGDSGRAGILSHGSVLAAFSKFSDTSPTQRGILVRSRLLCEPIPRPPATVDVDQPPGDDDAVCKYDRYAEHRSIASCASCHSMMDPIGFGLERFDIAGRIREHDDGLPECIIDGQGELPGYGAFSGPAELGRMLVDSGEVEECAVQQLITFAVGRGLTASELEGALPDNVARFQESGYALDELILAFVEAEPFVLRKEPEVAP